MLVVDDDVTVRRLVTAVFMLERLHVVAAASGAEAIELVGAEKEDPVLALVDVLMPGIDGLTLSRRLRTRFKRTRIVLMSGHPANFSLWPDDVRALPFLPKPFGMAALKDHLAAARQQRDATG